MEVTNKFHLPDTILRANAKRNADYQSKADRSVTQLVNPPQIDILRKLHFKEMTTDISEEFFSLFGSAVHKILEWGANEYTAEERLFATINGWTISGAIDLQYDPEHPDIVDIIDYKVTASYSIIKDNGEPKPEWTEQLNCYAYLLWLNKGLLVRSINVCAIIRDWQRHQAKSDPLYPPAPICMVPLPLWSLEKQEQYIRDRVGLHQYAVMRHDMGESLPECTPAERWSTGDKFAVMKPGGKRAVRTFVTEEFAREYIEDRQIDATIEFRPGKSVRCGFCGVAQWCQQYKNMNKEERPDDDAV